MLLDYENEMITHMHGGSSLMISGKGMGIEKIFYNFLKLYCMDCVLVLVINCSLEEARFYINCLKSENVPLEPVLISSEHSTKNHETLYNRGGVIFASSQIIVVDYLTHRIPGKLITGVLVNKAHKVHESTQEAFILRLLKENNINAFIKGFSENPISFTIGFNSLDRLMGNLQLKDVHLWPRFSLSIVKTLDKCKPKIDEVLPELTPKSTSCQMSILSIISHLLKELQTSNPGIDYDELTVENTVSNIFDKIISIYLDPIWNQLNKASRKLVNELRDMRRLLYYLLDQDAISFYVYLEQFRLSSISDKSNWILHKSVGTLIQAAKYRLVDSTNLELKDITSIKQLNIEVPPKWQNLLDLLKQLEQSRAPDEKCLLIVNKEATGRRLIEVINKGCKKVLHRIAKRVFNIKHQTSTKEISEGTTDDSTRAIDNCIDITASLRLHYTTDDYYLSGGGAYSTKSPLSKLHYVLRNYQPHYIIIYDPQMFMLRELENYQAELLGREDGSYLLHIYTMMYINSIEEQRYLTLLRKEKEAFQHLINAKANMVFGDFNYDRPTNVYANRDDENNTRIGGGSTEEGSERACVIVDTREFRSILPALLHKKGYRVLPMTLRVGDYILAPHIVVERKSVSDFIGSLNNGRLYQQCCSMTRSYPLAFLLIEFSSTSLNQLNSFSLFIGKNRISNEINSRDILCKLALLTIHFPKLRILWSQSPYSTVDLFTDLKINRTEPSVDKISKLDSDSLVDDSKYNDHLIDILLKIPGVTWKNYHMLANNITCLTDILQLTEQQLADLLDNRVAAKEIYTFLHDDKHELFEKESKESDIKTFKKPRPNPSKKPKQSS